jgi:ethanolamine ammonia-lyase large subunit
MHQADDGTMMSRVINTKFGDSLSEVGEQSIKKRRRARGRPSLRVLLIPPYHHLMRYAITQGGRGYVFDSLRDLMAKASPPRSGDCLAGVAAANARERVAARTALSDVPLERFLAEPLIDYEADEVTRLILDRHEDAAFAPVRGMTVGQFREYLLGYDIDDAALAALAPGLTPEMVAAVSKLCRNQDLILIASKRRVITRFRNTLGLAGRLSSRLQPNHPTDDPTGSASAILDGLLYGCGDAVIGINPATDSAVSTANLVRVMADIIQRYEIPAQSCVLAHVTTSVRAIEAGAPVDLVFQSIAGTQGANRAFGIDLKLLAEARDAALSLHRGTLGENCMYFETGQGSCLSAGAHHGVDQQTLEARAYAVAREFKPLLVNTVVGFIGPEYLYDGKQIIRAGLEDHFCAKLLGLPMGADVCHTNHADADQDDMDTLLTLLSAAGVNYIMGVPGADDIMLNYQSTSFHDIQYARQLLKLRPAPEFEQWLERMELLDARGRLLPVSASHRLLSDAARLTGG